MLRKCHVIRPGSDLTRIDRPDGTALVYLYDDPAHPGYMTRAKLIGTDGTPRGWCPRVVPGATNCLRC